MTQSKIAAHPSIPSGRDILVCIFQRGAADGLNSLVPHFDSDYYSPLLRPDIAVTNEIDLDGSYGLHPALSPLQAIWDNGDLGLVHATGIPHGSRSHFAAQGLVERGVENKTGPTSGWLGRHLSLTPPASDSAFRVISISGNVPVSLQGADNPLAISNLGEFAFDPGIIDSGYPDVLASLFRSSIPFAGPAQAALSALDELQAAQLSSITPDNGADYGDSPLGKKLEQAAQLIKSELPVEVVCMDSDDWDHHESLPVNINNSHAEMAAALNAFYTDMGSEMRRITLLVHTEFGRRIAQNGSLGTDHGTAGLAYLIGGGVNGGIYSDWPGLDTAVDEDLQITTDLRTVLAEMLTNRLGGTQLSTVFPGYNSSISALGLFAEY